MSLKTLKDMIRFARTNNISKHKHPQKRFNHSDIAIIEMRELRTEAIKWVKEDREYIKAYEMLDSLAEDICGSWMKRLNITEEDLK